MKKRLFAMLLTLCLLLPLAALGEDGITIPDLPIGEFEVPDNEAMAFLRRMGLGWNLGNTLDAHARRLSDEMKSETTWGNPPTTPVIFEALHEAGFGFVRIPITWYNHVDADLTIHEVWMDRVQAIVDMALDAGLIAIINTHHDIDYGLYYPDRAHEEISRTYVSRIWSQVAERFADYDERLIFEGLNEPRLKDTPYEWTVNTAMPQVRESIEVLNGLNQLFVDTVRAAGGENATRYLAVCGYAANVNGVDPQWFVLPEDSADNRIMVAAHAYNPYSFALDTRGTADFNYRGNADRSSVMLPFRALYLNWVSRGIPAYMGEWGSVNKNNLQQRVDHAALYVSAATQWNIPLAWWDNGATRGGGELFGILNRRTGEWVFPELTEALTRYRMQETETAAAE